jgi:hypothetical protein
MTIEHAATAGRQENSMHTFLTNFFTIPFEIKYE